MSVKQQGTTGARDQVARLVSAEPTSSKKLASNQRRLEALKRRQHQQTARKLTISLENTCSTSKHIVFATDSEGDDGGSGGGRRTNACLSGKQSLFSDLSEEEEEGSFAQFSQRKQFEGVHGEKLFRLQQKIGTDQRFRLDERFKETSEHAVSSDDDDDNAGDVEREKEQARRIIASLLGPAGLNCKSRERNLQYYEPSIKDPADLEHEAPVHIPKLRLSSTAEDEEVSEVPSTPVAGGHESFSKVSSSLKELLSRGSAGDNVQDYTFNFFASHPEEPKGRADDDEVDINRACPQRLVMAGNANQHEGEEEEVAERDTQRSQLQPKGDHGQRVVFFFHSTDPQLRNRLQENNFYRSKPAAELLEGWSERRAAVKLAYKRSRKQALKQTKRRDWSH